VGFGAVALRSGLMIYASYDRMACVVNLADLSDQWREKWI